MAVSLYDLTVATYRQVLPAIEGCLKKAEEHFAANKVDADAVADIRLAPDMLPFRFQVHSVVHHSQGAIAGLKAGVFSPPPPMPKVSFAGHAATTYDILRAQGVPLGKRDFLGRMQIKK